MAGRRALVLSVVFLVGLAAAARAQKAERPCPPELLDAKAAGDPAAYAQRTATYCDGVVVERHAGRGELPVIGVMLGSVTGEPAKGGVLIAMAGRASGVKGGTTLRVQGTAMRRGDRYRLDALVPMQETLRIGPESGMTKRDSPLRADEVAWAAWTDTPDDGRTYYPVTQEARRGAPLRIVVRPTIRASYLLYSVADASGRTVTPSTEVKKDPPVTAPGEAVVIELKDLLGPSPFVVQVTAAGSAGRDQTVVIRVALAAHQ